MVETATNWVPLVLVCCHAAQIQMSKGVPLPNEEPHFEYGKALTIGPYTVRIGERRILDGGGEREAFVEVFLNGSIFVAVVHRVQALCLKGQHRPRLWSVTMSDGAKRLLFAANTEPPTEYYDLGDVRTFVENVLTHVRTSSLSAA